MHDADGIKAAVTFKLSPAIRGPDHTHKPGYSCVDEKSCDNEKYLLCAQSVATADFDNVDILACMDGTKGTPVSKATKCAQKGKLPFDKITACFKGSQGTSLVDAASKYFDGKFPAPVGVPHLEINGKAVTGPPYKYATIIKQLCATGIQAGACKKLEQAVIV